MTEFLSKDPTKALVEVKEKLYDRLTILHACIRVTVPLDPVDRQMGNEIQFLENLLDIIERT